MIYITKYTDIPKLDIRHNDKLKDIVEEAISFRIDNPIKEWFDETENDLSMRVHNGVNTWLIYSNENNALTINEHGVVEFH